MTLTTQQIAAAAEARRAIAAAETQLWNLRLSAAAELGDTMARIDLAGGAITNTPNNCQCNSPQCNLVGGMLGGGRLRR
ncbi:hypothetical protein [Roseivivax sp. CAU 1753]